MFPRRFLSRLAQRIADMPLWQIVAWMWLFALLQNGLWLRPNIDSLCAMARDPYHNMLTDIPARQYLYTSYLGVLIAHYLGAYRNLALFAGLHVAELLVGWTAVLYLLRKRSGETAAKLAAVFFVIAPISNVLLTWLGIGDNLVIILASLLVLVTSPLATLPLAFLLGLAHTEQAGVIAGILIVGILSRSVCQSQEGRGKDYLRVAAMATGVLLAHLLLQTLFHRNQFNLQETRFSYFWNRGTEIFLMRFFRDPTATFYSLYLIGWIPVLALVRHWWTRQRRKAWWLLFAHAVVVGICMLVFDVTRVFSVLSLCLSIVALVELGREGVLERQAGRLYRWAALCLVLSFVVPKIIVWEGQTHTETRMASILLALGKIDTSRDGWRMIPFRP